MSTKPVSVRGVPAKIAKPDEVKVMEKVPTEPSSASEGFLLLDSSMNPIFVNSAAAQILAYPQTAGAHQELNTHLTDKIRSALILERPSNGTPVVSRFQSGRRNYACRTFRVNDIGTGDPAPTFAVLLERRFTKPSYLIQLQQKFHLTTREQEVAQFLLQGLTSKEIGLRMQISPNTVKAFLRLMMVKMGVSTRSGIIGKALSTEP